jgi:hypothetical protein
VFALRDRATNGPAPTPRSVTDPLTVRACWSVQHCRLETHRERLKSAIAGALKRAAAKAPLATIVFGDPLELLPPGDR